MRGKQGIGQVDKLTYGLIPAHAGKTGRFRCGFRRGRAHPRACGENEAASTEPITGAGSSPRMRGKRALPWLAGLLGWLIPAHAGKTSMWVK